MKRETTSLPLWYHVFIKNHQKYTFACIVDIFDNRPFVLEVGEHLENRVISQHYGIIVVCGQFMFHAI